MIGIMSSTRQVRARALQTSAMVCALVVAAQAFAQCAPDPTVANSPTTCTGSDPNGIRVTTPGTILTVASGATVTNATGAPITIDVPNTLSPITATVAVAGQVSGGAQNGITVFNGPASTYYGAQTRLRLTVANGGVLSGSTALTMSQTAGNSVGQVFATIDNAGAITGSSGIALRGDIATTTNGFTTSNSGFDTVTNRATGTISGGIVGPVGTLTNAGLIDGGSGNALTTGNAGTSYPYQIGLGAWTNSGTIRSNSGAATIVSSTIGTLSNSGTIANTGAGAALSSSSLVIQNLAGGQIRSGGATAINGTGYVNIVNRGTITGNIVTGNTASVIDSSQGRINGSVVFGASNDTLIVRYDGTAVPVTGITGTITAGGGTNIQQFAISTDTTIATPVTLLTGFQQLAIATDKGVTTTLGTGFVAPATIQLIGGGTLVNRAAIVTPSTAFVLGGVSSPDIQRFVNEGSIQTGTASAAAIIAQSGFSQIVNNGTITAAGSGINSSQASVLNTGTLTASATGVTIFGNGLTNSGLIRSTAGVGAQLSGNVGTASTNSGTIQGATTGVQTSGYLTNTGTITATGNGGTAVRLDAYGVVFNNAGGVIGNGGQAISGASFNQSVVNAGTINGTVSLTSNFSNTNNSQRYISQGGGILNGNLVLGADGVLFTDLVNTGPGQFAGITGTISAASGAVLRYRVAGTQAATLGPVGPFAGATYELTSGASLTLTAPSTGTRQVALAGTGTVDITANLSNTTTSPALAVFSTLSTLASNGSPTGALAITSRGTIAVSRATGSTGSSSGGVVLGSGDSFANLGTITVSDRNATSFTTGIAGGAMVTNSGSILLDGGIGISGGKIVNTGSIVQIDGGATARGVTGGTLDNQGSIRVGGLAMTAYNNGAITNSGSIASTAGIAISGTDTSASARITNASGGTITGAGVTAVRLYYGTFTNAGAVNGSVDMGYGFPYYSGAPTRSFASSAYIAAGGTIAGDLLFGDGADLLLQTGPSLGVSSIVDGGAGIDIYGRSFASSGSVAIDVAAVRNFEDALVEAVGATTVVTATASNIFAGNLYVVGDGGIVNQAAIKGRLTSVLPYSFSSPFNANPLFPANRVLASITNTGSVAGGASVVTSSFINTGTIGSATLSDAAVSVFQAPALAFANSGTIASAGRGSTVGLYASAITFANSGTITSRGDIAATLTSDQAGSITATNSGTITGGFTAGSYASYLTNDPPPATASVSLVNSGTITRTTGSAVELYGDTGSTVGSIRLENQGVIDASGPSGAGAYLSAFNTADAAPSAISVTNGGTIRANGGGVETVQGTYRYTDAASALLLDGGPSVMASVANQAGGTIEATGTRSSAIFSFGPAIDLTNAGTIRGGAGTVLAANDALTAYLGRAYLAGAVQASGATADRIINTGTIIGSVDLGAGNDRIENRGRIEGNVFLGAGDDTFLQLASAGLVGTVDAGAGIDQIIVDSTGGGTVNGDQFVNFERFSQIGNGNVTYSGSFRFDTIGVSGGGITVAAGQTLSSDGPVTLTGSNASETVTNNGTIAGSVALLGGDDRFVNAGILGGAVALGDGDDEFV